MTPLVFAQSEGFPLTSLAGSTRSAALAGAGVAVVGDAGAVFANPAGIVAIRSVALEGSYERYLAGTLLSSVAIAARTGRFGWGVGAQVLDYGSEPEIVPDPATGGRRGIATGGMFRATDLVAISSLAYDVGTIAVGASAKYARQLIGDWSTDTWGADVGVTIAVPRSAVPVTLAVSVQNLGGDLGAGARLPRRSRVGLRYDYIEPRGTFRVLAILEGQWPGALRAGVEAGVVTSGVGLVGRAGYAGRPAGHDASRFSTGAGVELGRLHLDYAYQGHAELGAGTHRVGLRWTR